MNKSDIDNIPSAATAAQSGDWTACATAMAAHFTQPKPRSCGSEETTKSLVIAGENPSTLLGKLLDDPDRTGTLLASILASKGVEWANPLTMGYLAQSVAGGRMSQTAMDTLVNLSSPKSFPFAGVTADDCQTAWNQGLTDAAWATAQNEAILPATSAANRTAASIITALQNAITLMGG